MSKPDMDDPRQWPVDARYAVCFYYRGWPAKWEKQWGTQFFPTAFELSQWYCTHVLSAHKGDLEFELWGYDTYPFLIDDVPPHLGYNCE